MSFVVFGDLFSFPEGFAATNRVHTYAKGINELGASVHVICFSNEYVPESEGTYQNIFYHYPFNQSVRSKKFLIRRWQKIKKYINTMVLFRKINKKDKVLGINVWSDSTLTLIFIWFISIIIHSKLIRECSEHPLNKYRNGIISKSVGTLKFKFESLLFDGILCISRYLLEIHKDSGIKSDKLLLVPSTVDPSRFTVKSASPVPYEYLGYFGSISFERDNVDLLIKAFKPIHDKYPDFHLVLGGYFPEHEKSKFKKLIEEYNLTSRVLVLEYLSREKIIQYINHAKILIMSRSDNMSSQASFPSKLTEYLAASKPIITVDVGEIRDYLEDGVNAYLVKPGNVAELTEKIDSVLKNYDKAVAVSFKGNELTRNVFNYKFQAKRILEFVKTLN